MFFYFILRPNNISRFPLFSTHFSTIEKSWSKIALLNCWAGVSLILFHCATSVVSLAAGVVTSRTPFPITAIHLSRMFILFYWALTWPTRRARNETHRYHAGYPLLPFPHSIKVDHQWLWPGMVKCDGDGKSVFFLPFTRRIESLHFCKRKTNLAHILIV